MEKYRNFRVTYLEDHVEKHITVSASNQQGAMQKVKQSKGIIPSRAFLIKE